MIHPSTIYDLASRQIMLRGRTEHVRRLVLETAVRLGTFRASGAERWLLAAESKTCYVHADHTPNESIYQ